MLKVSVIISRIGMERGRVTREQRGISVEATLTVGEAYVGIVTRKERGE